VLRALYTLKSNGDSGHFLPVLEAATAAMMGDQGWLAQRNEIYRERRDLVMQALRELGWQAATPKASLYVWFHVPDGWDSESFAGEALERSQVSLTPGTVFGVHGEGYMRLSFTQATGRVAEAMDRLVKVWS
jgi:LL-diaminopimelate aminotransferase